jgi:hypothetical protein
VRWHVRVAPHSGGEGGQFELDLDEAPPVGAVLGRGSMVYEVVGVHPDEALIEAEWRAGPGQYG